MSTREELDLFLGHPGFDQRPTPRPVTDDDVCARCRHPRWMHDSSLAAACCFMDWEARKACRCRMFQEYEW